MPNAPHHKTRRYRRWSGVIRTAARLEPAAVCWSCGLTLAEFDGSTRWVAGHTVDGSFTWTPWLHVTERPPRGDWLAPQHETCNARDAARQTNAKRNGYRNGLGLIG